METLARLRGTAHRVQLHELEPARQQKTRKLAEDAVDLLLPLAPLLGLPEAGAIRARVRQVLADAGLSA